MVLIIGKIGHDRKMISEWINILNLEVLEGLIDKVSFLAEFNGKEKKSHRVI